MPRTIPSEMRRGIFSGCGATTSPAVFPSWTLFHDAVKEPQSAPMSGAPVAGKLAASGEANARNSGSLRVAQDFSPPMMGLAIEPNRSEISAEGNRR